MSSLNSAPRWQVMALAPNRRQNKFIANFGTIAKLPPLQKSIGINFWLAAIAINEDYEATIALVEYLL